MHTPLVSLQGRSRGCTTRLGPRRLRRASPLRRTRRAPRREAVASSGGADEHVPGQPWLQRMHLESDVVELVCEFGRFEMVVSGMVGEGAHKPGVEGVPRNLLEQQQTAGT